MDYKIAVKKVKIFYGFLNWPAVFVRIRFFTAPFKRLAGYVPQEGFIIDLGCGYGIFSALLGLLSSQRRVLGIDLDEYKISRVPRGLSNVDFKLADIKSIDLPAADCILLVHVLHHLNSYQEQEILIISCLEKLKVGGRLLIAEIDRKPWWKLILTQIADRILYNFNKPLYRFPKEMLSMLQVLPLEIKTEIMHQGTPFSHISYICVKQ